MVVLDGGQITCSFNISSSDIHGKITNFLVHPNCVVVIEDIRPYSLRLTQQVIDTCKFIGELNFSLKTWSGAIVEYVIRSQVKKWCFDKFPSVCAPIIEKKILKKGYVRKDSGEPRSPSFVFVDDKIVTECMKFMYSINKPKSGKGYQFGLKGHSWQALAIASYYRDCRLKT